MHFHRHIHDWPNVGADDARRRPATSESLGCMPSNGASGSKARPSEPPRWKGNAGDGPCRCCSSPCGERGCGERGCGCGAAESSCCC